MGDLAGDLIVDTIQAWKNALTRSWLGPRVGEITFMLRMRGPFCHNALAKTCWPAKFHVDSSLLWVILH